ncbi:MAG: UDP-3-O-(3-hydroxymyristoyl)glucosamine N-acyltransferase [Acidobacteriota bacterium]|nr:MAG: UDP-3-O-(3-hydroxymyristoyl)glucosamine N-acyltransferase [Acidobacteriota bacterium]
MKAFQIAELVGGEVRGDGGLEISGVASFSEAGHGALVFTENADAGAGARGSCVLAPEGFPIPDDGCVIVVAAPKAAFCIAAGAILVPSKSSPGIHPTAVIADNAVVGENVSIGAFVSIGNGSEIANGVEIRDGVCVGDNVRIGKGCVLNSNVSVYDNCIIGDNVVIHAGAVIGADGFGFVMHNGSYLKFPQVGRVVIGRDVEIGANTCIDRGALGETRIGDGTKIDNLVQIAHNVEIGRNVVIAAQTGISGSTVIEDDCVIGGQVGMGDHARVLSGAVIGSQAGVLPGKIVRPGVWWGTPVQPLDEYKRQNAMVKGIKRLKDEVKELRKLILGSQADE